MLLVYVFNEKVWGLYNGIFFDYFFVLWGMFVGVFLCCCILIYYLEGLFYLIDLVEKGEVVEEILIKGSFYFFSEWIVKWLGFELVEIFFYEKYNFYFNFLDLLWKYLVVYKILCFFNLKEVKMVQVIVGVLFCNCF